jgi:toxin HigB-1
MIASFACRHTHALWLGQKPTALPSTIHQTSLRKLTQIQAATSLVDLRIPPGNRLEALKGKLQGLHSIRVNDQYRVCFRWDGQNAHEVEITDYH